MEPMKPMAPMKPMEPMTFEQWCPKQLGHPSSSGGQNGIRYAFFPEARRLLIERAGELTTYDSGDHRIGGVSSQQQSGGEPSLTFSSQHGSVRLDELRIEGEASSSEPRSGASAAAPHRRSHEHEPDRLRVDERIVFSEEGLSASTVKLVVKGEMDLDMIEAVEEFLRRQKRRLSRPQS